MAFHEVRFPEAIGRGARGGPERRTQVVELSSGDEERNASWANSRRRYDVSYGIRRADDLAAVVAFFEARNGRLHGFRFRDWSDYLSGPPSQTPSPLDQPIGTGDGTTTAFQLTKRYASGAQTWVRSITKPVAGSVKGVWTFGIGHTATAGAPDPARIPRGMPADLDAGIGQAFRLFRADLVRYQAAVQRAVAVPLELHEFDALVSFHYNTGAIAGAAVTRALNAGDRAAAGAAFMNWLRPASLRPRREAERDLFLHGRYPEGSIPVWAADAEGRVDFRQPVRRLGALEALALLRPPPVPPAEPDKPALVAARPSGWLAAIVASLTATFSRS